MRVIQRILSLLEVPYTKNYLRTFFVTNPNKGNLLGYANVLSHYGIASQAIRLADINAIKNEYIPCVASYDNDFVIIENIHKGKIELFTSQKSLYLTTDEFIEKWNGVLLLFERNEHYGEPFFDEHKTIKMKQILCFISVISWLFFIVFTEKGTEFLPAFNLICDFGGLAASFILVRNSQDANYENILCIAHHKFDCKIHYTIMGKLELADVCFAYFTTLLFLFTALNVTQSFILLYLSLSLPFVIWSVYYQITVLKKYCPFCIFVQFFLIGLFAANLLLGHFSWNDVFLSDIFLVCLTFVSALFFIEIFLKKILETAHGFDTLSSKNNFLKEQYLLNIEGVPHASQLTDKLNVNIFNINNDTAKEELICVLNPFCKPCSSHYIHAYNSLFSSEKIRFIFYFTYWNEKQREALNYIFMAIVKQPLMIREIIFDWYTIGVDNLSDFINKYDCSDIDEQINQMVIEHKKWCSKNQINVTPTLFYNGYKLPKGFNMVDVINL